MNTVIDMKTRNVISTSMTVKDAEAIVGEGMMMDELLSTKDLCSDDRDTVEACDVLIAALKAA